MESAINPQISRLPSLHGLRAFCVLIVIAAHLAEQQAYHLPSHPAATLFTIFLDGELAVNVFFVISGFLITTLLINEERKNGSVSIFNFFARRTLRIFPAYYALLGFYAVIQMFGLINVSGWAWITAITYTKYLNWWKDWLTAHAWSLSIEEHFYLTWPFVFALMKRYRGAFCVALVVGIPILKLIVFQSHLLNPYYSNLYLTIFFRCDAIAIGCLFALKRHWIVSLVNGKELMVAFCALTVIVFLSASKSMIWSASPLLKNIGITLGTTSGLIANAAISVLIICTVFFDQKSWRWLLNNQMATWLGSLSYSLYLWQQFYLNKSDYWINQFPQNLILLFMTLIFSYQLIEKPFLSLKSRFS